MEENVEKVEYVPFAGLPEPGSQAIAQQSIELGFNSKEWFIQFQTLSNTAFSQPTSARPTATTPPSSCESCCRSTTATFWHR